MANVQYLTYSEYVEYGGTIPESAFSNLERKAEKWINYFTQDRIKSLTTITDEIKECMTEFVNKLSTMDGDKVASFSNDGVSVNLDNSKTDEEIMWNIADMYLPIELICRAVN